MYEQLFAQATSPVEVKQAIARAVRLLREAMEKEDNAAVTAAHVRNLHDIAPEALGGAYALAEKTCTFWPTPGQIRELAGCSDDSRALTALQWVFGYLTKHGCDGRPRGGGVRFGEDETGRRVLLETEPEVAAPEIPMDIDQALWQIGGGSVRQGLRYLSQHPAVKGWDSTSGDVGLRIAQRLEAQWARSYLKQQRRTG
jgi:hypothetical protein